MYIPLDSNACEIIDRLGKGSLRLEYPDLSIGPTSSTAAPRDRDRIFVPGMSVF